MSPLVVCIDDEPSVLSSLSRLLRDEPYRFLTTGDYREILAWVAQAEVRVILADQRMPEMSGSELAKTVHNRDPRIRVAIITGYAASGPVDEAVNCGYVRRVIFKPWDGDEIKRTIRELLQEYERTV